MRKLVIAVLSAAALGVMIVPSANAAPINGAAIQQGAGALSLLQDVRYCRTRRWCNRRGCYWRRRCWR